MISRLRILALKALLIYGLLLLAIFGVFRVYFINFDPYIVFLSVLLVFAEFHILLQFFTILYSLWPRNYPDYEHFQLNKNSQINIFICVCGEPASIVRNTIEAAIKARDTYISEVSPATIPNIVVLNDGKAAQKSNWQDIEKVASTLGVGHIAREHSTGFKAGNINNALQIFTTPQPHETFDIILDSDFAVVPTFLIEITKPFADNGVDFVQTPQRYVNETTWIAKAAAAHQIHFFSHVCAAKAYHNALFLCGTNFAIRRSALEAVGGMDERFITEDYATSINLHLAGKQGTFIDKPLAYGIAPSSLRAYFSQQQRWSKGTFDTSFAYARKILFGNLSFRQKFQYLVSSLYYLVGVRNAILILAPLPYFFFNTPLIKGGISEFFLFVYGPFFIYNLLAYFLLFRHPFTSWVLDMISFPVYISALLSSVFKKNLAFVVTIKNHQKENLFKAYGVQMFMVALLLVGLVYAIMHGRIAYSAGQYMNYVWVVINISLLSLGILLYVKDAMLMNTDGITTNIKHQNKTKVALLQYAIITPLFIGLIGLSLSQLYTVRNIADSVTTRVQTELSRFERVPTLQIPSTGIYYGYYSAQLNTHPRNPQVGITPLTKGSLAMFYTDWSYRSGFDRGYMKALSEKGIIPVVTWEPWDAGRAESGDRIQIAYSPKKIASGRYDTYIRNWARGAAEYGQPFFLRFAHEMNGEWYPWAYVNNNTPEDYRLMWQHVHDIFEQEGAMNVLWVWAPNNEGFVPPPITLADYYPGDNYVDWVGFSGFNWGDVDNSKNRSFAELAQDMYKQVEQFNKPIMIAETATVGTATEKIAWYKGTAESMSKFPRIKALVIFNQDFNEFDFEFGSDEEIAGDVTTRLTNDRYFVETPKVYATFRMFRD